MQTRNAFAVVALLGLAVAGCGNSGSERDVASTGDPGPTETSDMVVDSVADESSTSTLPEPLPTVPTAGAGELPPDSGPELEWTEVAADVRVPPGELVWTGSSFIIASHDQTGSVFLQSFDGITWDGLQGLPKDADLFGIHAAGESIVVWGADPKLPDDSESDAPPMLPLGAPALPPEDVVMFISTDGGASWADGVRLELPATQLSSPYLREFSGFATAAINGDTVIVVIEAVVGLDFERILAENDTDTDLYRYGYEYGSDGISICLFPAAEIPTDGSYDNGGPVDLDDERLGPCADELALTFEQLGLTDDDVTVLMDGAFPFKIYRSNDGGPFESAADVGPNDDADWHPGWLRVVNGEFVGSMTNETGLSVISRSADGLEWELGQASPTHIESVTVDGSRLYGVEWSGQQNVVVRSDDSGRTWTEVDVGNDMIFAAFGGPAGLAVTGQLWDQSAADEPRSITIDKDGYIVTFDEDGLTVVEVETGETMLAFGPSELGEAEPPENVIAEPDGSLTFLDPGTLTPLVNVTESDFADAAQASFAQPEFFIGWSADGEHWGWQTVTEAFAANGGVQIAVGDDAVVAMYQPFDASDTVTVRIFIATP